ncbi:hypothetical protein EDD85DRAFT_403356 [Armillaria nabsnona]|nr:hypothetical protein EDD85DRAFT_403356 [Armillaria nabsnona]
MCAVHILCVAISMQTSQAQRTSKNCGATGGRSDLQTIYVLRDQCSTLLSTHNEGSLTISVGRFIWVKTAPGQPKSAVMNFSTILSDEKWEQLEHHGKWKFTFIY